MSQSLVNRIEFGLSFEDYRARDGLSISLLKKIARSPLHFRHALGHAEESECFSLGRAAHCATLEPERFGSDFAVWARTTSAGNSAPRNGQHWEAFLAANAGKEIVTSDQYGFAAGIRDAVRANPDAMKYLRTGRPEVSIFWGFGSRQCRGRIDWLHESDEFGIVHVGLKTAQDCRNFQFGRQAARFGYPPQWAFYYDGYKAVTGRTPDRVVEIVAETKPPHASAVYIVPDEVLQKGAEDYMAMLEQLEECERSGHWPGPNEAEQMLLMPDWYFGEDEIEGIEYVDE